MNELKDISAFLRLHAPFDQLSETDIELVCRSIEISFAKAGTVMLAYGADNDFLFLLRRGAVELRDAHGALVTKRGEGGLFGYPSLLTGKPARLAATLSEDSLIYHIPASMFDQLRRHNSQFDRHFSLALGDRLQLAAEHRGTAGIFHQSVKDLMTHPPITAHSNSTILASTRRMSKLGISCLPIVSASNKVQIEGIFTDRDLRNRVVAADLDTSLPVANVMSKDLLTIGPDVSAMDALALMTESGIHHLPVVANERLIGLITLSDVSQALNASPVHFAARLRRQKDAGSLATMAAQRIEVLREMSSMGVSARHAGRIMTSITDAATRRLLELAEARLGPPPMAYAWLCFGSQARRDQTARTDQDNGLVLAGEPTTKQAQYFEALASFVCDGLNECGFVYCPGSVMASNIEWRMSLLMWQRRFKSWIDEPSPKPLMYASIFFDMRGIFGQQHLVSSLQQYVCEKAGANSIFLRHMAINALSHRPPLGFFRRFTLERDGAQSEGVNLKQRGVVPIISIARIHALENRSTETDTVLRLAGAPEDDANADLSDALELIGHIRLDHQVRQHLGGNEPTNIVNPDELSPLTRRNLKAAFVVVSQAQKALELRYQLG